MPIQKKTITFTIFLLGCVFLGILTAALLKKQTPAIENFLWPTPKVLNEFSTVDQLGRPFSLNSLHGQWSFVFFGYTYCPDICPVTLSVFNAVEKKLQQLGNKTDVQFIFVTVDPKRDTPERLADYLHYFNPDFIGVTGTENQLASLARQLGVSFFLPPQTTEDNYLVDHSASVFLIDPKGRLLSVFSAPQNAMELAIRFQKIVHHITEKQ